MTMPIGVPLVALALCHLMIYDRSMRTIKQLQAALLKQNALQFSKLHSLPLRTIMRIRAGSTPRKSTHLAIDAALNHRGKK
jgi:hypothetical protein